MRALLLALVLTANAHAILPPKSVKIDRKAYVYSKKNIVVYLEKQGQFYRQSTDEMGELWVVHYADKSTKQVASSGYFVQIEGDYFNGIPLIDDCSFPAIKGRFYIGFRGELFISNRRYKKHTKFSDHEIYDYQQACWLK